MMRWATERDLAEVRRLAEDTYCDSKEYNDFYFSLCWRPERCMITELNGAVAAAGQVIDMGIKWRGDEYPCSFIYALTSNPRLRERGLVKAQLDWQAGRFAAEGRSHDLCFVNLKASRPWQSVGFRPSFPLYIHETAQSSAPEANARLLTLSDMHLIPQLDRLYESRFASYAHAVRTPRVWQAILTEYAVGGGGTLLCEDENGLSGYCVYDFDGGALNIRETAALDAETEAGLAAAAMRFNKATRAVRWEPPTEENLQDCTMYGALRRIAPGGLPDLEPQHFYMNLIHN